ncbi:MAG: hypothetical protein L3J30_02415, partial [Marinosulfonomonas sp.]|nr:hypothetical protein [Marinosulfonomonas sp.]
LRDLVRFVGDAGMADGAAHVTVTCHDDMQRQSRYDLDQPMPLEMRRKRVLAKSSSLIGPKSQTVWQQVQDLERSRTLDSLIATLF